MDNFVEMRWQVFGDRLPADHCYRLYSALSRYEPKFKKVEFQLNTIAGIPDRQGWVKLGSQSELVIRCAVENIPLFNFDNQVVRVGDSLIQFKQGQGGTLSPKVNLRSRIVTIKSAARDAITEFDFGVSLGRQLGFLGIKAIPQLGKRQVVEIKHVMVVGFEVYFEGLLSEDSFTLQRYGLGGRRKMGCGVFV